MDELDKEAISFLLKPSNEPVIIPEEILSGWQDIVNTLAEASDCQACLIRRFDENGLSFDIIAANEGAGKGYRYGDSISLKSDPYCKEVLDRLTPITFRNIDSKSPYAGGYDYQFNMLSYLGLPIFTSDNELFGTLCLMDIKAREYADNTRRLVELLKGSIEKDLRIQIDTKKRQAVHKALQKSEDRYRIISEITSDFAYGYKIEPDNELQCEWVTGAFSRITGYTPEEFKSKGGWESLLHPEDLGIASIHVSRLVKGKPNSAEYRIICKGGAVRWIRDSGRPFLNVEEGRVTHIYGAVQDITEQKNTLDALKESEERFRSIFENNTIGLYRTTPDGRVLMANDAILKMLRISSREELNDRNLVKEGYPPDYSREWFRESLERNGKITGHEAEWKRSDGTTVFVRESARVVTDNTGEVLYYEGTVEDITEQKSAQETLRKSEERYRKLYTMVRLMCDNVPDMIWAKDMEKRYIFANKSLCQNLIRAADTSEPIGKTDLYFVSRQQESNPKEGEWRSFGEMCGESDAIVMETRQPLRFDESGYVGGNYLCLDVHKTPFLDENGEMIGTVGSARDVTLERQIEEERRKAEEALRESDQRFRDFATAVTDVIYRYDPVNNRYDFLSPSIETMLGIPVSEIIANPRKSASDMVHPDDVDRLFSELEAHIAKGAGAGSIDLEYRMIGRDGRVIWVNDRKVIEFTPEGKPYRINGVVTDITEKKRTEELLRRRDGILRSCGYLAELILKTEDFERGIKEGLMNLGKATGVSRVYIFKNVIGGDGLLMRQLYEWADEGIEAQIDNPELQNFSYDTSGARRFKHLLSQGEIAFGTLEELSADERAILQQQDILSIAIVPINVKQKWWGFMGFDDCMTARIWSAAELNVLKAAAGTIGAAIERKQNELALMESEERYSLAVRAGRTGVWDLSLETGQFHTYGNLPSFLGLHSAELPNDLGELMELIHPDDRELIQQAFIDHREEKSELLKAEHRIIRRDGDSHWVLTQGRVVKNAEGEPVRLVGTTTDINEQKLAQEKLKASLGEKEVLLKEIYHRVKNNLQVISSLFDLQLDHIDDDKARAAIKTNQNRIGLMAIIHEQLYQSPDLSMISFPGYIRNLIMSLFESYGVDYDRVAFEVGGDDVYLSIDAAIPCGLIINELVTNSLKHAFPQGEKGVISIEISAINDRYLLTVSDRGIGIPEHIDLRKSGGLGWQLINLLIDQLNGSIRRQSEKGASFRIEFTHIKPL